MSLFSKGVSAKAKGFRDLNELCSIEDERFLQETLVH